MSATTQTSIVPATLLYMLFYRNATDHTRLHWRPLADWQVGRDISNGNNLSKVVSFVHMFLEPGQPQMAIFRAIPYIEDDLDTALCGIVTIPPTILGARSVEEWLTTLHRKTNQEEQAAFAAFLSAAIRDARELSLDHAALAAGLSE